MTDEQLRERKLDEDGRREARRVFWTNRDRDSYECPDCGRQRDDSDVDGFDVHHRDGNPRNNDPSNLVGLCRTCHHSRHGQTYDPVSVEEWQARFAEELCDFSIGDIGFMTSGEDRTAVSDGGDRQ